MLTLGQIATSDYNLLGAISEDELLGALERANLAERKQFVRRVQAQTKQTVAASTELVPKPLPAGMAESSVISMPEPNARSWSASVTKCSPRLLGANPAKVSAALGIENGLPTLL